MSFGWSVGDVLAAIKLLVNVADALKDTGGAKSQYQQDASYLNSLADVLQKLQNNEDEIPQATALLDSIDHFRKRLHKSFEGHLGKDAQSNWWGELHHIPRKIHYGIFVKKEVDELRLSIDIPLKSILIRLGLQNHGISREIQQNTVDTQLLVKDLSATVANLPQEFAELMKTPDHFQARQIFSEIATWLKPIPCDDVFAQFLDTLASGSCEWISRKDQFLSWMTSNRTNGRYPLLWVTGAAGYGKTRLATKAIEMLRFNQRLAFFYCDAQDANKRSFIDILRNWCWQLLSQDQSRLHAVNAIKTKRQLVSETALMEILNVILKGERHVILVIDALDECEAHEQVKVYRHFSSISQLAKLLVFSRPLQGGLRELKKAVPEHLIRLELSEADTQSDINQYIESTVAGLGIYDTFTVAEIVSTLQSKAQGMFLWVALMIEELQRNPQFDESQYLAILEQAPMDLDDLYYRILQNLSHRLGDSPISKSLFRLVLFSRRPLSLQEISAAMRVTSGEQRLKNTNLMSNEQVQEMIVHYCGPLVTVHQTGGRDSTVNLVHYSLKEYVEKHPSQDVPLFRYDSKEAHGVLAKICLTYLCYDNIDTLPYAIHGGEEERVISRAEMTKRFESYIPRYPLLEYSTRNWWWHVTLSSLDSDVYGALQTFCTSKKKTIRWLQVAQQYWGAIDLRSIENLSSIAAIENCLPPSDEMFTSWLKPFARPRDFRISLNRWEKFFAHGFINDFPSEIHVASFFGFEDVVEELIQGGVDANERTYTHVTPLFFATMGCSYNCMKLLISHGADVNATTVGSHVHVPLTEAVGNHQYRSTQPVPYTSAHILLEAGANPFFNSTCANSTCNNRGQVFHPLCESSPDDNQEFLDLVTAMLERGAKAVINKAHPLTPLHWSVRWRNDALTRLLLSHGASVDTVPPGYGQRTTLLQACAITYPGALEMVQILLNDGASVDSRCGDGRSALHLAAKHPIEVAKLLLKAGAQVNARAKNGCTPLHDAVVENNAELIALLITHQACLDLKDFEEQTSLDLAIQYQNSAAMQLLEEAGASFGQLLAPNDDKKAMWPREGRDIFEAYWIFRNNGLRPLPHRIIIDILDTAKYWQISRVSRMDQITVAEKDCEHRTPYLTSESICGQVKEIKIVIWSHDQGFSDYREHHGTFDDSWTWFELGIERPSGKTDIVDDSLATNVHASSRFRRHQIFYRSSKTSRQPRWMEGLKIGDKISIIPKALYPGWKNTVREASIEIYTSCVF